jgi:hypothetical protein
VRYFVLADKEEPIAIIFHDYKRGSYICRSVLESVYNIFDACVTDISVKYAKGGKSLQAVEFSANEYDWFDAIKAKLLSLSGDWSVFEEGESSASDLTVDDIVSDYLI